MEGVFPAFHAELSSLGLLQQGPDRRYSFANDHHERPNWFSYDKSCRRVLSFVGWPAAPVDCITFGGGLRWRLSRVRSSRTRESRRTHTSVACDSSPSLFWVGADLYRRLAFLLNCGTFQLKRIAVESGLGFSKIEKGVVADTTAGRAMVGPRTTRLETYISAESGCDTVYSYSIPVPMRSKPRAAVASGEISTLI